jgi:hypothetical protein
MPRLALLAFRDVLVTPYIDLMDTPRGGTYHRGGPHWPEWSTQTAARYCVAGKPLDEEPPKSEPTSTLTGPIAWGSAITWHFGHQIADFTTRLLPTLAEMPDVRFAFSTHAQAKLRSIDYGPAIFPQILDWYGIPGERVDVIADPTLVERLVVAPQAEQTYGPGPEPWYLDLLDANMRSRLGEVERGGSLYVSRAGQRARFAGEAYLEGVLEEAGFRVLRPETVSLEEQLRAYAGAERIVFAEGSAIHGVQLLGRALGNVTVLMRRPDMKLAEAALKPRARSLRYVDAVQGLVHGCDINGHPARYYGLSILDPGRLLAALPIGHAWDHKAFDAARGADVGEWLERERASPRWAVSGSPELVAQSLHAAGLGPTITDASHGLT